MAAAHYVTMFIIAPLFCLLLPFYLLFFTKIWWICFVYVIWFYYDFDTPRRGGRERPILRRWFLWSHLANYFPIRLEKTIPLDAKKNYIFGIHPHGILSIGAFVNFCTEATNFSQLFPGFTCQLCTLVGQFWYPLRREYGLLTGAIESSKESIRYVLSKYKESRIVAIVVGGGSEVLHAIPGTYDLVLKNRKGFVKIAIEHGTDLVPVFSFGENDIFVQKPAKKKFWKTLQINLKRYLGYTPPIFYGRGIFNCTFGLIPFRKPITTIVGCPVPVPKVAREEITSDLVEAVHEKYCEELSRLFETNKQRFGVGKNVHINFV